MIGGTWPILFLVDRRRLVSGVDAEFMHQSLIFTRLPKMNAAIPRCGQRSDTELWTWTAMVLILE